MTPLCPNCRYQLVEGADNICPECGVMVISPFTARRTLNSAERVWVAVGMIGFIPGIFGGLAFIAGFGTHGTGCCFGSLIAALAMPTSYVVLRRPNRFALTVLAFSCIASAVMSIPIAILQALYSAKHQTPFPVWLQATLLVGFGTVHAITAWLLVRVDRDWIASQGKFTRPPPAPAGGESPVTIVVISRLYYHKGTDLLTASIPRILAAH
ncbi:MAG: hypothetical protein AAF235_01160, partial [Planctomycetota bacterium]